MVVPVPLPSDRIRGVIVVNIFAFLSSVALVSVACRVIWLVILQQISPATSQPKEYVFFNTQLGYYAICLLVGNLLTDLSGLVGLQWLLDMRITDGGLCAVQAVVMQTGNWAIGYFTVAIALHTFNSLVMQVRQSAIVSTVAIAVGWLSAGLLAAGPFIHQQKSKSGPFYGISQDELSCGIPRMKAQFFYHLLPIFVASVLSAILYSVIFLVLRGTLTIKGGVRLTLDPYERWSSERVAENYHRFVARIARSMLWYPFAYIVLLVPYSVTRLLSISGYYVPLEAIIFAYTCWFMLGIVNVALLYNTFRVLGPALDTSSQKERQTGYHINFSKGHFSSKKSHSPPSSKSPTIASFGGRFSPRSTARSPLSIHQERSASLQSYYSYSNSSSISIGRDNTPYNDLALQRSITPSAAVSQEFIPATTRFLDLHSREGSNEPVGLPATPRPTRSPVLHHPSTEQMRMIHGTWSRVDDLELSVERRAYVQTFGKRDSGDSRYSSEVSFRIRPNQTGNLENNHPILSTMKTSLPPVSLASSLLAPSSSAESTPAPTGRQRSVLTSRQGLIGNSTPTFNQQFN